MVAELRTAAGQDRLLTQHDLRPADIILTASPELLSGVIRLFTLSDVSHAMLYVGHGQVVESRGTGTRGVHKCSL